MSNLSDYRQESGNDPVRLHAARLAAVPAGGATYQPESKKVLWAAREGQVVNFWVYLVTALTFWLVIPLLWAAYRYCVTAHHRWELTDQRLLEYSGVVIRRMESLELYRVEDIRVGGTFIQSMFGCGQVTLLTRDKTTPQVTINAIDSPAQVLDLIRMTVEQCRVAKGVRAVDV